MDVGEAHDHALRISHWIDEAGVSYVGVLDSTPFSMLPVSGLIETLPFSNIIACFKLRPDLGQRIWEWDH